MQPNAEKITGARLYKYGWREKIRKVEGEDVAEKIFGGKTDALEGCSHHSNENMGGLPLSGLPNFGTSNKTKVKSEVSLR